MLEFSQLWSVEVPLSWFLHHFNITPYSLSIVVLSGTRSYSKLIFPALA